MQLTPLLGFAWRQNQTLKALFGHGNPDPKQPQEIIDSVTAMLPVLKRYYPALNTNGMLDDALATLKEVLAPPVNIQN